MVLRLLGGTEGWAMEASKGLQIGQENLALSLQHSNSPQSLSFNWPVSLVESSTLGGLHFPGELI